jgi:hypothetical protein
MAPTISICLFPVKNTYIPATIYSGGYITPIVFPITPEILLLALYVNIMVKLV